MRNKTGKPYAIKEYDDTEGVWIIYFDPAPRLDGYYHYSQVSGPIDVSDAELIVKLLNEHGRMESRGK